jgi:hypothetical protein
MNYIRLTPRIVSEGDVASRVIEEQLSRNILEVGLSFLYFR